MEQQSPTPFKLAGKRIWVAGHRGMVGSAVMRRLVAEDCEIRQRQRHLLRPRRTPISSYDLGSMPSERRSRTVTSAYLQPEPKRRRPSA